MSTKLIMFCTFIFILGTFVSLNLEGSYFGQSEVDILNALTGFSTQQFNLMGAIGIPRLAIGFFTTGVPKIISWNYSFLNTGGWVMIKWFLLWPISAGVIVGICIAMLPALSWIINGISNLLSHFIP